MDVNWTPFPPWSLLLLPTMAFEKGLCLRAGGGGSVSVPLCEGASLPGLLANLQFGELSETGNILLSQLQRGAGRETTQGGPALQTWESHGKGQRCQPTQDSPPSCPHPVL